jgi:hypothetical protein
LENAKKKKKKKKIAWWMKTYFVLVTWTERLRQPCPGLTRRPEGGGPTQDSSRGKCGAA